MPERGHHTGISAAPPPPQVTRPDGAVPGYRPRRALGLGIEVRRQLTRRRTAFALGFQVLLPLLLVAAFLLGDDDDGRSGAPALVDLATSGAANFTVFTLFVSSGFLLAVVVALFAGDTVASEASWSSLRYLLAAPVPRARLLWRKLVVALAYCGFAFVLLPVTAFVAGGVFFGWAPLRTPLGLSVSGGELFFRLAVMVGYVAVSMLFIAALGFLLGVITDAPLGAVGGAVLLLIVSNILDQVTALGEWRRFLPTRYAYAYLDALSPEVVWTGMARGALWSVGYALVLFSIAWWHFTRKDVTS